MNEMSAKIASDDPVEHTPRNSPSVEDEAHIYRSKIVDKCAESERYILVFMSMYGEKPTCQAKAPLGQKIVFLRQTLNALEAADARVDAVLKLLDELSPLAELRSELVHSTLSIEFLGGCPIVVLQNAMEQHRSMYRQTVITIERIKAAHGDLSRVTNGLKQAAGRT